MLQSPTVLIFTRGHNLKARIDGFYDRTAIVQAVKNVRWPPSAAVDLQGVEVDRRSARKDGREVVALRCVERA